MYGEFDYDCCGDCVCCLYDSHSDCYICDLDGKTVELHDEACSGFVPAC